MYKCKWIKHWKIVFERIMYFFKHDKVNTEIHKIKELRNMFIHSSVSVVFLVTGSEYLWNPLGIYIYPNSCTCHHFGKVGHKLLKNIYKIFHYLFVYNFKKNSQMQLSNSPFLQFFPSKPFWHWHWLGAIHRPPFLHPPWQTAKNWNII